MKKMMILAVMMVMTISARSAMPLGSSKNAMSYNAHPKVFVSYKGGNNRRGITNHTLASNKPRHGHSRSTSGRLLP